MAPLARAGLTGQGWPHWPMLASLANAGLTGQGWPHWPVLASLASAAGLTGQPSLARAGVTGQGWPHWLYRIYTAQLRHSTAWVRHGLFGPRLHCGNQRRAHGVINRHVSLRAYSRLFGGCYATVMAFYSCSFHSLSLSSSSQSSLKRRRQRM